MLLYLLLFAIVLDVMSQVGGGMSCEIGTTVVLLVL